MASALPVVLLSLFTCLFIFMVFFVRKINSSTNDNDNVCIKINRHAQNNTYYRLHYTEKRIKTVDNGWYFLVGFRILRKFDGPPRRENKSA